MARVLVTDGEQRAALAVVRSLGRARHEVIVAATTASSLAGASRYCTRQVLVPDPLTAPDRFVDAVQRITTGDDVGVCLPITEAALSALLPVRERLAATIPFATHDAFQQICNKQLVLCRAATLGIDVPAQLTIEAPAELGEAAARLRYPVVIKPARSVVTRTGSQLKLSVRHAADAAALKQAAAGLPADAYPLLVQQRITGAGLGVFVLLWDDEVVAAFAHRRLREKPPSGGVSVYCESRPLDPALLQRSTALLRSFGWSGVAMVEYKVDDASGRPQLMEVNGRFWGSLQLAIDAGVDFPALLVELAEGRRPNPVRSYSDAARSRWLMGDVDHLLTRLRRSPAQLSLPPGAPGRGRALLDFLAAFGSRASNEVFRMSDVRPGIHELARWLHRSS